jgi:hypothetical protein
MCYCSIIWLDMFTVFLQLQLTEEWIQTGSQVLIWIQFPKEIFANALPCILTALIPIILSTHMSTKANSYEQLWSHE